MTAMGGEVELIGVPTDFGTNRRGVDMGPSAIRYAGISEHLNEIGVDCVNAGDIDVPATVQQHVNDRRRTTNWTSIRRVCERLQERVEAARKAGNIPLILGGDHSIAIGSVAGVASQGDTGLLWFDAHADFNTPATSPSGNIHGMPLAVITGQPGFERDWLARLPSIDPDAVGVIGLRNVDFEEATLLQRSPINTFTMSEIDRTGIAQVCEHAIEQITPEIDSLHVSLDLDFLDPIEAPGVGTPVRGGVTYREAHLAMEVVAAAVTQHDLSLSMDIVEVNPILDEANETAKLACELTASALGDRVLSID